MRDFAQHAGLDSPYRRRATHRSVPANTPTRPELETLITAMGMPVRELMRAKEAVYQELGLDNPALSDNALIDAMLAHPILINRPIVVTPLGTRLCRPAESVLDILPQP